MSIQNIMTSNNEITLFFAVLNQLHKLFQKKINVLIYKEVIKETYIPLINLFQHTKYEAISCKCEAFINMYSIRRFKKSLVQYFLVAHCVGGEE